METNDWYFINDAINIDTPALIFYPSRMKANIDLLKNMTGDIAHLRPHVKTHKTREATLLMIDAGIRKFKCATIAEAEMLGSCGAPDVLLAYQPVGPKVLRFISVIKQFPSTSFSCLVDSFDAMAKISAAAIENKVVIQVYVDLNVGMDRTGIEPGIPAIELYELCASFFGVEPVGFHFYDGHIRNKDITVRALACQSILESVTQMRDCFRQGDRKPLIVAGGSPTFPVYSAAGDIDCSPGTFILWDAGYMEALPEQKFLPAAIVLTRIISMPTNDKICIDLGYKSIASENPPERRAQFLNATDLKIISHSEEHMVLQHDMSVERKVGDVLYVLPVHICPTCALHERALIVKNGQITESWKIVARDRKITL